LSAWNAILRDLRLAVKSLRRSSGFTFIAIVTLGLGIGANSSMFSILDGYMLRPAPYPESDRLDRIYRATPQNARGGVSPADYNDLKSEMNGYGEIAAYAGSDVSVSAPGSPAEMTAGLRVSANLFSTLGSEPRLGRGFRPEEEILGNHRVLVLSDRYWQNRFGGDPHIVGRTVRVDGEPYEVVGVLPPTFSDWRYLSWVDLFRPLGLDEKEIHDRSATWVRLVGRRSKSLTREQAGAFIESFGRRLASDFPASDAESNWLTIPMADSVIENNGAHILAMLVGLSGFVLLIACSNLANLLLARTMARAREFALRSALGASRSQMLRPLLVESLLLALAGGVGAILIAMWTFDWFAVVSRGDNGVGVDIKLDWHVLSWAFVVCLLTAVAFGVAPALFALRLDLNGTLKSGSRGNTGDRGHRRFRQLLIVGQFTLAMVLLAGAALFVRGLHELNNRRYGWESDELVTGTMLLPIATYPGDKEMTDFQRVVLERLEALPGVLSASVSYSLPFFGLSEPRKYLVEGREPREPGHEPAALINGVSSHYFETVGTRVLEGRTFDARDTLTSPRVFIVNEAMARGLFGEESPIGRRIARAGVDAVEWGEIVGVVADVQSVAPEPSPVAYQLYQPMAQEARPYNEIAVRTTGVAASTVVDGIRMTMMSLDANLPVRKLQPAAMTIARANYQLGVLATVLSSLAVLGLGLATLGVYGVIARTMAQRTLEFGVRIALGAQARDISRLVLTSAGKLAILGSGIGLLGAIGVSKMIVAGFPAIQTNSVPVLVGVTLLLIAIAQIACYIPARKASRISPIETLRSE
jgi:putative ABC transport system permease protein